MLLLSFLFLFYVLFLFIESLCRSWHLPTFFWQSMKLMKIAWFFLSFFFLFPFINKLWSKVVSPGKLDFARSPIFQIQDVKAFLWHVANHHPSIFSTRLNLRTLVTGVSWSLPQRSLGEGRVANVNYTTLIFKGIFLNVILELWNNYVYYFISHFCTAKIISCDCEPWRLYRLI